MDHDGESGEVGVADREAREALEPVVVPEELFDSVLSSVEGRGKWGLLQILGNESLCGCGSPPDPHDVEAGWWSSSSNPKVLVTPNAQLP